RPFDRKVGALALWYGRMPWSFYLSVEKLKAREPVDDGDLAGGGGPGGGGATTDVRAHVAHEGGGRPPVPGCQHRRVHRQLISFPRPGSHPRRAGGGAA